jgi:hypothetical protein
MQLLGVPGRQVARQLAPVARASAMLTGAAAAAAAALAPWGAPPAARLAIGAAAGVSAFWMGLGAHRGALLREARRARHRLLATEGGREGMHHAR